MLRKGQMIILILFLINKRSSNADGNDPQTESSKSKLTTSQLDPRGLSDPLTVHRMEPTNLTSGAKPPLRHREPITINKEFAGNNGRIHKLYYVIPGSSDPTHRKRFHEVKVRLRQRRDLRSDGPSLGLDENKSTKKQRKRVKRLAASIRRWRLQRLKRELNADNWRQTKELLSEEIGDDEKMQRYRPQRRKVELNDAFLNSEERFKGKRQKRGLNHNAPTEIANRQRNQRKTQKPKSKTADEFDERQKRNSSDETTNEVEKGHCADWWDQKSISTASEEVVDRQRSVREKRVPPIDHTERHQRQKIELIARATDDFQRKPRPKVESFIGAFDEFDNAQSHRRQRRELTVRAARDYEKKEGQEQKTLIGPSNEVNDGQRHQRQAEVNDGQRHQRQAEELTFGASDEPDEPSIEASNSVAKAQQRRQLSREDARFKAYGEFDRLPFSDDASSDKNSLSALQRLKRELDSGGLNEVDIRWRERMRTRTPRDHKFVTKSQLKIDRVTSDELSPVIKVYSMPEEGISTVIRAGKSRDFNYQSRAPMKRIIYYATLPEIIRRPTAPEWLARQSGAFNHRLLGSAFGSGLLPSFTSGPGQGSVDFTRIQSALMDVRPPRDNLSPVTPQLTLFNLDRFPSLNDIASTNSIHGSDGGSGSEGGDGGGGGSSSSSGGALGSGVSVSGSGGSSSNDNSAISGASDGSGGLSPLSNNYISNLVSSLNQNGLSSLQNSNSGGGGGGSFGYQPAPYYTGPFPTRHHRFPPYHHPSDPYQQSYSLGQGQGQGRNPHLRITTQSHHQQPPLQSHPSLTLNNPPLSSLTLRNPPPTLNMNNPPSPSLTLNNLANYQLDHEPPHPSSLYNTSRLSNLLSSTSKYPPYYYDYTSNKVDPLKNHLLFSPTWATSWPPTALYERITPTTHSTHSVVIDSHSVNINATNVSTGNSTRITPPVVTNLTQHYESHE